VKYFCSACMKSFLAPKGESQAPAPKVNAAQFTTSWRHGAVADLRTNSPPAPPRRDTALR